MVIIRDTPLNAFLTEILQQIEMVYIGIEHYRTAFKSLPLFSKPFQVPKPEGQNNKVVQELFYLSYQFYVK